MEKSEHAKREEEVLAFWKEKEIFKKTLEQPAPKGEFVFYDGPPFATGLPHYGHLLAGTIKDILPRYKTMRGYRVQRRWGWDCHGLPVENLIEKELGLKDKRAIEELGVHRFNKAAREAVLRYESEWKKAIPRFGRFVDMDRPYRTMDAPYTESVWWAFSELNKKGLIYKGFKPMHLCPRCGTTLSNFEVALGYKEVTDLSLTVKFPLVGTPNTYMLAWTTTPWTLPGNMALAVHREEVYVEVRVGSDHYIVGKSRLDSVVKEPYDVVRELRGAELVGTSYTPPFPYYVGSGLTHEERAWKVYAAEFVTMESGTGIVHIAPAFGAEDLELGQKEGIPIVHHVDTDGRFVESVVDFAGTEAKPRENPQATDVAIIKSLSEKTLLFSKEKIVHTYPHCWRCDTPLLNYASTSWFVSVASFKEKLLSKNNDVSWIPKEVGEKRFGNWLLNARDWSISRSRYWGAPLPVWESKDGKERVVVDSIETLRKYVRKNGNTFLFMRHGESEHNVEGVLNYADRTKYGLTEQGKKQVKEAATLLKTKGVTKIFYSPLRRTKETADSIANDLGIPQEHTIPDERLRELNVGFFDGKGVEELQVWKEAQGAYYSTPIPNGESYQDAKKRFGDFLYDIDATHKNETILVVSHGISIESMQPIVRGFTAEESQASLYECVARYAEVHDSAFVPIPHNDVYELDLHRPYIDDVALVSEKGTELHRTEGVFDCWFESGSMPYASIHYPFDNKDSFTPKGVFVRKGYPADFIAEGLDQTRGWFYSLLVLGTALFGRSPYRRVIVNGLILAEDGQKMSKRLNNYPDPMNFVDEVGADAIRFFLISSPVVRGEDLRFSEKGVRDVGNKLIARLVNVLSLYELAHDGNDVPPKDSTAILDRWILSRLNETIDFVEAGLEEYELDRAARPLLVFVDDLSTWYVRRSRERLKGEGRDTEEALSTLRIVLTTISTLLAPFTPFVAEYVYQRVRRAGDPESVHLTSWPKKGLVDTELIKAMEGVRAQVSEALMLRQKVGIPVRQPLASSSVRGTLTPDLLEIYKEEVNVKDVVLNSKEVALDTTITPQLEQEGNLRQLIRDIQDARKEAHLVPKDLIHVTIPKGDYPPSFESEVKKAVHAQSVTVGETLSITKV